MQEAVHAETDLCLFSSASVWMSDAWIASAPANMIWMRSDGDAFCEIQSSDRRMDRVERHKLRCPIQSAAFAKSTTLPVMVSAAGFRIYKK